MAKPQYTSSNDEFNERWKKESENAIMEIDKIPLENLVNCIIYQEEESHSWKKINRALERLAENKIISEENANLILKEIIAKLSQYTWEHYGCTPVLEQLLNYLGENASWQLAESILLYLDEDYYYALTSNMFFLIKQNFDKFDLIELFNREYSSQYAWISGNGYINLKNKCEKVVEFNVIPANLTEALFIILLENLSFGNIHRMEIALPAIYNMSQNNPELFRTIINVWKDLSDHAQNALMVCSIRWARERADGFQNLAALLKDEYKQSNILSTKYILHTVLKIYEQSNGKEGLEISFIAQPAENAEYRNRLSRLHKSNVEANTRFFLDLLSRYENVDDLYQYMPLFESKSECKYSGYNRDGDSVCISNIKRDISQQILYREERKGRWSYIPLHVKKQWLLTIDDAYLMTSTPCFSYADYWNVESVLVKMKEENKNNEIEQTLQKICINNDNVNEVVLGSVIWYPLGQHESFIYTRVGKVLKKTELFTDAHIYQVFMNYSAICDEDFYFELGNESEDDGGSSLMRTTVGTSMWYYNNPMVCPTNEIIQSLELHADFENPFVWYNSNGEIVLRYERIANPVREIIQQFYIRQPVLGRWLCNKQILEEWMNKDRLQIKYVSKLEEQRM